MNATKTLRGFLLYNLLYCCFYFLLVYYYMTIWEARSLGVKHLQHAQKESNGRLQFETPTLDCDCLLTHVLEKDRSFLLAHNRDFLEKDDEKEFFELLKTRCTGMPVAYIVGKKEFFGFVFYVTGDVLIPKADTELLVEKAIEIITSHFVKKSGSFLLADICTGSGCIALSIVKTMFESLGSGCASQKITCHCVDISRPALDIAHKNALSLLSLAEQDSVRFFQGDLLEPVQDFEAYDMIVSNPPYVPSSIVDELLKDGRGEPRLALDGDVDSTDSNDGCSIIKRLVPKAWASLKSGGVFLIETGEYNAEKTLALMSDIGFVDVATYDDLAGLPRVSYGIKP